MLASSRRKPKLTLRDQERFLSRKREVDRKIEERKEAMREVKKSEDFLKVAVGKTLVIS